MIRPARAFLDVNVFVVTWILDTLLALADRSMLESRWSEAVLEEVREAVSRVHGTNGGARYVAAAERAFSCAMVDPGEVVAAVRAPAAAKRRPPLGGTGGSAPTCPAGPQAPSRASSGCGSPAGCGSSENRGLGGVSSGSGGISARARTGGPADALFSRPGRS